MKKLAIYIHESNDSPAEHFRPLFPNADVVGMKYTSQTKEEAFEELPGVGGE